MPILANKNFLTKTTTAKKYSQIFSRKAKWEDFSVHEVFSLFEDEIYCGWWWNGNNCQNMTLTDKYQEKN